MNKKYIIFHTIKYAFVEQLNTDQTGYFLILTNDNEDLRTPLTEGAKANFFNFAFETLDIYIRSERDRMIFESMPFLDFTHCVVKCIFRAGKNIGKGIVNFYPLKNIKNEV